MIGMMSNSSIKKIISEHLKRTKPDIKHPFKKIFETVDKLCNSQGNERAEEILFHQYGIQYPDYLDYL